MIAPDARPGWTGQLRAAANASWMAFAHADGNGIGLMAEIAPFRADRTGASDDPVPETSPAIWCLLPWALSSPPMPPGGSVRLPPCKEDKGARDHEHGNSGDKGPVAPPEIAVDPADQDEDCGDRREQGRKRVRSHARRHLTPPIKAARWGRNEQPPGRYPRNASMNRTRIPMSMAELA
jgi:hypothetical protein